MQMSRLSPSFARREHDDYHLLTGAIPQPLSSGSDLLWGYFCYICRKQKAAHQFDFKDVLVLSLEASGRNGQVGMRDQRHILLTQLLSHASYETSLKWPVQGLRFHSSPAPLLDHPLSGRILSPGWSGPCCAAGGGWRVEGGG